MAANRMKCSICGCTDDNACPGGCYWAVPGLCSECAEKITLGMKKIRKIIDSATSPVSVCADRENALYAIDILLRHMGV